MVEPCPECAAGKHWNCTNDGWDDERDEMTECPCYLADPDKHQR